MRDTQTLGVAGIIIPMGITIIVVFVSAWFKGQKCPLGLKSLVDNIAEAFHHGG